ncbi:hypothetical protein Plhal304r1_c088g0170491 [Plasmopara halstedii]
MYVLILLNITNSQSTSYAELYVFFVDVPISCATCGALYLWFSSGQIAAIRVGAVDKQS